MLPAPDSATPSGALWTPAAAGSVSTVTAATSSPASFVTLTGSDTVRPSQAPPRTWCTTAPMRSATESSSLISTFMVRSSFQFCGVKMRTSPRAWLWLTWAGWIPWRVAPTVTRSTFGCLLSLTCQYASTPIALASSAMVSEGTESTSPGTSSSATVTATSAIVAW